VLRNLLEDRRGLSRDTATRCDEDSILDRIEPFDSNNGDKLLAWASLVDDRAPWAQCVHPHTHGIEFAHTRERNLGARARKASTKVALKTFKAGA
jgi:hypothetical protein